MKFWSKIALVASLVFLQEGIYAQVEVNVKLSTGQSALQQVLAQAESANFRSSELPAAIAQRYPFLSTLTTAKRVIPVTGHALESLHTLQFTSGDSASILSQLINSGAFEFAEINHMRRLDAIQAVPNDDSLSRQWYHAKIKTFDAWNVTMGADNVRIGVIDTGLDYEHPEFQGQVAINSSEDLNQNGLFDPWPVDVTQYGRTGDFDGIDNDNNGFADDVIGYDFTDQPRSPFGGDYLFPDPDPLDENSHGTIVSGVIAAKANNLIGGTGIAPDCRIVVLRAFAANGQGEDDDVSRAIIYAADNGIKILNFSFGDIYPSLTMHEAIRYAYNKGVVMVSSAGNTTGDELHYPSGYNEVISVSASAMDAATGREYLWPFSSYGLTVDLAAPGSGIYGPTLRDSMPDGTVKMFDAVSGTSVAAPMVTAGVGMLFTQNPSLSPRQARGLLVTTTDDIGITGWDHLTGAGRLNLDNLLNAVAGATVQIISPENDRGSNKDTVWITGTVLDPEFVSYSVEYQAGTEDLTPWNELVTDVRYQTSSDTLAMWDLTGLPDREYTLRIKVIRTDGSTTEDRVRFIRDRSAPVIKVIRSVPMWDNQTRNHFIVFRASDAGYNTLVFRKIGETEFREQGTDRTTRNGEFLLGPDQLPNGTYEYYIRSVNLAGLEGVSATDTFTFARDNITQNGYDSKPYLLPMGRYLEKAYDFDEDGLKEVVMSRYSSSLAAGKLMTWEFNGSTFVPVDSISIKPVLIPKDVADTDGDGLLELLCSVNDSTYIFKPGAPKGYPNVVSYTQFGDTLYAAALRDTDGDDKPELLLKNFEDYFVYKGGGASFSPSARLTDVSPDYMGSIAPRVCVADFDGDGKKEVLYGDFDGDLILYEYESGASYRHTWTDTTDLTKSGVFVTQGDFDGDGVQEFFTAVHPSLLRNNDFEYNSIYLWLRIFKSTGDDQYEVVWEDYVYDLDADSYNAATAGNLDLDSADEIVFTSFPRTYVIDHQPDGWHMQWFHYGDIATQHVIGDFDGNGVNEVGIGRGDSTIFYERDLTLTGPEQVATLRGVVTGSNTVSLIWNESPSATGYDLWRIANPDSNTLANVVGPLPFVGFDDEGLVVGTPYLYVLQALNPSLSPPESGFGNAIVLTPHARPRLDSVRAVGATLAEAFFSQPMNDNAEDRMFFRLDQEQSPVSVSKSDENGSRLLLGFAKPFTNGSHTLVIDTLLLDAGRARMNAQARTATFNYQAINNDILFLTHWELLNDTEAVLYFSDAVGPAGQVLNNYEISPVGKIEALELYQGNDSAIKVSISGARFGALGYPLSIDVQYNLCSYNGACIGETGHTATFTSNQPDLKQVYVYPNPVRSNSQFEGMRFANLTRQATIEVLTVSGRKVVQLEETDGDGGYEWNLIDQSGKRIAPGVYLYRVYTDDLEMKDFLGKFTVVE